MTGGMTANAFASQGYRENSILTAPPERLVVMLYDGANRFLIQAADLEARDQLLEVLAVQLVDRAPQTP